MMAKKSKQRGGRQGKDQSGCMGSLINLFDFRLGRSSQKLLLDKKRESKRVTGAAYSEIHFESLTASCKDRKEVNDNIQGGTSTIVTSKPSVKKLMEDDMCGVQDQEQHDGFVDEGTKQNLSVNGARARARRTSSLDLYTWSSVRAKDLGSRNPSHRKHSSASSVDLDVMVEELCSRIHHNDVGPLRPSRDGDTVTHPTEDPSVLEEKLWEATKVLVNHFARKSLPKDGKIQPSKELIDAVQILDSNKEVFLKLLQDPSSEFVKHVRDLQDVQVEEGKIKVLTGNDMLDQHLGNVKQSSSFWRRFKGVERNSSKKSSSGNGQGERIYSAFSFSKFKKKLKQAIGKEQHDTSENGSPLPKTVIRKKIVGRENIGLASPSRDHFFIERIPKSSAGLEKTGKPKDGRRNFDHHTNLSPEQRVSSINAEAKKHLAEIVGNSDTDLDTLERQVSKPLGSFFSRSDHSSPTICSPRHQETKGRINDKTCESQKNIVCPKNEETTILPSDGEDQADVEACHQASQELKINPCIDVDHHVAETNIPDSEPSILDGVHQKISIDKPISELEASTTEDVAESIYSLPSDESQDCLSTSLRQDINKSEPSSSHSTSTLTSSMTEKNKDVDVLSDATSKPSPVSVLEPRFKKDISPFAIKSSTATKSIKPRKICFEEQISAASVVPSNRICVDGDKYTVQFVKDVVQMSGLTWDELRRRSLLSYHLIEPSLIDEVDFLPDLLSCDFYLLFDLVIEVLTEIHRSNFTCIRSLAKPSTHPKLKGKDLFSEVWKGVEWYLKLEGAPHTLQQTITQDLAKETWMDLRSDGESVGILVQQAILDELVEDTILNCGIPLPVDAEETEMTNEL